MSNLYRYPNLNRLIQAGHVYVDSVDYIGKASDGEDIYLGSFGDEPILEQYFIEHPDKTTW